MKSILISIIKVELLFAVEISLLIKLKCIFFTHMQTVSLESSAKQPKGPFLGDYKTVQWACAEFGTKWYLYVHICIIEAGENFQ